MMIHPLPVTGKLPIKTLVARQLPTNVHVRLVYARTYMSIEHTHIHTSSTPGVPSLEVLINRHIHCYCITGTCITLKCTCTQKYHYVKVHVHELSATIKLATQQHTYSVLTNSRSIP